MKFRHLPTTSLDDATHNFEQLQATLPSLVAALPNAATDGQECYYLADATNGVVWHLRYRAVSPSAHRWEYVGGAPLAASLAAEVSTESATYVALTGPSIALPLAGDYDIGFGCTLANASLETFSYATVRLGGAASDEDAIEYTNQPAGYYTTAYRTYRRTGLAAETIAMYYRSQVAAKKAEFRHRDLWARPVRVG